MLAYRESLALAKGHQPHQALTHAITRIASPATPYGLLARCLVHGTRRTSARVNLMRGRNWRRLEVQLMVGRTWILARPRLLGRRRACHYFVRNVVLVPRSSPTEPQIRQDDY
jgi:hypothetical protein